MSKLTLQFVSTTIFPAGRVCSTARRGHKYDSLNVGDVVHLEHLGGETHIGDAVLVAKEKVTLRDVLENADHNQESIGAGTRGDEASKNLHQLLERAYGSLTAGEPFMILHLLIINK